MRFAEGQPVPAITGLGMAVPEGIKYNTGVISDLSVGDDRRDRVLGRIMGQIGLKERHWVTPGGEANSDLSSRAIRQAMEMAGVDLKDVSGLVIATHSPDEIANPVAARIQNMVGFGNNITAYDLGGACPGWGIALKESMYVMTSPMYEGGHRVIVGTEIISPALSTNKPETYMLFGDGSGAVVLQLVIPDKGAPTNFGFSPGVDGSHADDLGILAGGSRRPARQATIDEDLHSLAMNGRAVRDQAIKRIVQVVGESLANAQVPKEEVNVWGFHQANAHIVNAVAEELGIPRDDRLFTIDRFGNTSSASIPMLLKTIYEEGKLKRNDMLGFASFGSGFLWVGGIIPMVGLPRGEKSQFEGVDVPKEVVLTQGQVTEI